MVATGLLLATAASCCATGSSFAMRSTLGRKGTAGGYLSFYFLASFLLSVAIQFKGAALPTFSLPIALTGLLTGFCVVGLMSTIGYALKKGPSGLTFAFLNCGSIMPPLLMALIFSEPFGFSLSVPHLIGCVLVLFGLFWAARGSKNTGMSKSWPFLAALIFLFQSLILTIFDWRCLLFQEGPSHLLIPFHCEAAADVWFMPMMFLSAFTIQSLLFFSRERRIWAPVEFLGGGLGGVVNGISSFLLLTATSTSLPAEKVMLFPLFAVLTIIFCNFFGQWIYKEKVPWYALGCCALGICIGVLG